MLPLSKYLFVGRGNLGLEQQLLFYVSEQTITCSKSATKALEIREDNPKENIFGYK